MEELLNKLIEKGWKPFGIEGIKEFHLRTYECERGTNKIMIKHFEGYFTDGIKTSDHPRDYGSRMYVVYGLKHIVAKESGLWQFVCENGMYRKNAGSIYFNDERAKNVFYKIDQFDEEGEVIQTGDMEGDMFIHISKPEYRIIESSLRDESELEDFLIENIKI